VKYNCIATHLDHAIHTACHKVLQVGAGSHTDHPGSVAAPLAAALLPLGGARAPYQALGQIQQPDCAAGVAQQGGTVQKVQAGQLQSRSKQWVGKGQSGTGQGVSGALLDGGSDMNRTPEQRSRKAKVVRFLVPLLPS
jgi:hypothetical protein